jgi:hypothetical protein
MSRGLCLPCVVSAISALPLPASYVRVTEQLRYSIVRLCAVMHLRDSLFEAHSQLEAMS